MLLYRVFVAVALVLAATSEAFAAWHEARTKHFIIYSEQNAADLKAYAERLERFDAAVRTVRGIADPLLTDAGKVTIYVLPSVDAVRRLHGSGHDSDVLGFYSPRASGSVAFVSNRTDERTDGLRADHVFQHEYLHHLMLSAQKTPYPAWMVEGYAEFFGTAVVRADGAVEVGHPPQARGYGILSGFGFGAEQLLTGKSPRSDLERSSVYGRGWLLTHYLAFNDARRGQLSRYIEALSRGEPAPTAARSAFGDLKALDRELNRYATGRFPGRIVSPGPTPSVSIRALGAGANAIMPVRIRSDRGVNAKSAPVVVADARRIAASYPNDSFVQGVLAEAEFDVKDYAAAIAAAERALAADPKNGQAMVYKGRALMALARADKAKADWAEVRRWFIRANRADTENAEPLWLYYQSFLAAGEAPTKPAVDGLLYAQTLAPHDMGLRFSAVRQLLVQGKAQEAEPLFAQIIFNPHIDTAKRPELVKTMDKIRARDAKGALDALMADRSGSGEEDDGNES